MLGAKILYQQLKASNADVDGVLKEFGLGRRLLFEENAWVPYEKYALLFERVAQISGDEFFGLRAAKSFDPRDLGPIGYIGLASRTLGDSLLNLERYYHVVLDAFSMSLSVDASVATISFEATWPSFTRFRQATEFTDSILIHTYKTFVGDQFQPIEMRFPHSFAGASTLHEELLGFPVKFNHEFSELILPHEALLAPIKSADHRLLQILTRYCEEVLSAHANRVSDLVTKFERLVLKLLPSGRATAQIVAAELGMSERTLARRLAQENTSFTETLDTLRQEMPLKYLHRRDLQLSEVAFLLGYAIHSSFCVAFKRWTGKSPSALRSA